jgi:hypothetical protein
MEASRGAALDLVPSRYRVHLLPHAKPTERGVLYRRGEAQFLLEWGRVRRVLAGCVGAAPLRVTVFDLVLEAAGPECVVARVELTDDAEAERLARAIAIGVRGADRAGAGLRPAYPDLDGFEAAALEAVRFRGVPS